MDKKGEINKLIVTDRFNSNEAIAAQEINRAVAEKVSTDPTLARIASRMHRATADDSYRYADPKFSTRRAGMGRFPGYGAR